MINVIKNKYIFLTISGLLIATSIFFITYFGLKTGIDFVGGVSWQIAFHDKLPTREEISKIFPDAVITPQGDNQYIIRLKDLSDADKRMKFEELLKNFGALEELNFQNIGSVVGADLRNKAIWAFGLVLAAISIYVAFAFRKVSQPVSSWKYGIITLVTLFHDALIPAGLYAILGRLFHAEVDTNFIVAILVVMGFSVHDTIVVFDRIRENLRLSGEKSDFNNLVNNSVNQTIARSINTSLTLVLTLVALLFLGPVPLQYFVLTILVGTVVGTYSSIFVASPLLTLWRKK